MSSLRRKKKLSQRAVAGDLGISQALLSHYENGAREPGLMFVCKACSYFGVSADYMLGRSDSDDAGKESGIDSRALDLLNKAVRSAGGGQLEEAVMRLLDSAAYIALLGMSGDERDGACAYLRAEMALAEIMIRQESLKLDEAVSLDPSAYKDIGKAEKRIQELQYI